ncbi:MAG TPA: hypothetical protein VM118_12280 [Acidobacteriota bacterium]|nr:hypothetical protein [Acidobacteriota bacterium]
MKPAFWRIAFLFIAVLGASVAGAEDNPGKVSPAERMRIDCYPIDTIHWQAAVALDNASLLAAMTLPLSWGHGDAPYLIDSATYGDTRLEYFALKTYLVDTAQQNVLIGLISDLGMGLPPLEPGNGPIVLLHFTRTARTSHPLKLDSTFIPPHNTLQLVTPDVRAITPQLEIRLTDQTAAAFKPDAEDR